MIDQVLFYLTDDKFANFRVTVTSRDPGYSLSGIVEEVEMWDTESGAPSACEHYLDFTIRPEGYARLTFNDLLFVSEYNWTDHIALMQKLYEWSKEEIAK